MKHLTLLICVTGLTAASHFEQDSVKRDIWRRPSSYRRWEPTQQDYSQLLQRSLSLQRRTRSPSPTNRSKITAKGPARIFTEAPSSQNRRERTVPHHGTASMPRHHHESVTAGATTPVDLPPEFRQPLKAEAKGHAVVGFAKPRPGGTGTVRVENENGSDEVHYVSGSTPAMAAVDGNRPGVAKVVASTDNRGGAVTAIGMSRPFLPPQEGLDT